MSKTWTVESLQVKRATSEKWFDLNPVLKAGEIGFDTTTNNFRIGNGYSRWSDLPYFAPKTLENYSWEDISIIAEQGLASSYFKIGDEKNITLTTGELITVVILDFLHDTKSAGGLAGITFGMKDLLTTTYAMNNTDTTVGGWTSSAMRNSTMVILRNQLPSDLRSFIKPVNKLTSAGDLSSSINTTSDNLFIPSEVEVYGNNPYSFAGEGSQYLYYRTASRRIKKIANGAGGASPWFLRSPNRTAAGYFVRINGSGAAGPGNASSARGVSFCFCI